MMHSVDTKGAELLHPHHSDGMRTIKLKQRSPSRQAPLPADDDLFARSHGAGAASETATEDEEPSYRSDASGPVVRRESILSSVTPASSVVHRPAVEAGPVRKEAANNHPTTPAPKNDLDSIEIDSIEAAPLCATDAISSFKDRPSIDNAIKSLATTETAFDHQADPMQTPPLSPSGGGAGVLSSSLSRASSPLSDVSADSQPPRTSHRGGKRHGQRRLRQAPVEEPDPASAALIEFYKQENYRRTTRSTTASTSKHLVSDTPFDKDFAAVSNSQERTVKREGKLTKSNAQLENYRFRIDGRDYEYQARACLTSRYQHWPRCIYCVRRTSGDTCRFVYLRVFPLNADGNPVDYTATAEGAPFLASERFVPAEYQYPSVSQVFPPASPDSIATLKATAAAALLATLRQELALAKGHSTIWRRPELEYRPQCEACLTSLFSSSYLCRRCGAEYCLDCSEALLPGRRKETAPPKPILYKCLYSSTHRSSDLVPMTRIRVEEAVEEVQSMNQAIKETNMTFFSNTLSTTSSETKPSTGVTRSSSFYQSLTGKQVDDSVGSLDCKAFDSPLKEDTFTQVWALGDPIVVHGCLEQARSTLPHSSVWGPESFQVAPYDDIGCTVSRCDADLSISAITVATFFSTFGQSREEKSAVLGEGIWKLKDWPDSSAFDREFPELYEHFNAALPVPAYTRRDGRMNVSAHFPKNANAPDLGPKMYNAWSSTEDQKGMGSTRLHMDIADAVNIMYYAAVPSEDAEVPEANAEGVAAWDIFPAQDSNAIRRYLQNHRSLLDHEDPIHSQRHFLDASDRQRLWDEEGVRSWRIYQKVGDAIFIPAGCAHQVCNLADCMKVAVDFISPQNVSRCFQLTAEFRGLNQHLAKAWKEDVLQLKSNLWHAWRACREMEGHRYSDLEVAEADRERPSRLDRPLTAEEINSILKGSSSKAKGKGKPKIVGATEKAVKAGDAVAVAKKTFSPRRDPQSRTDRAKATEALASSGGMENDSDAALAAQGKGKKRSARTSDVDGGKSTTSIKRIRKAGVSEVGAEHAVVSYSLDAGSDEEVDVESSLQGPSSSMDAEAFLQPAQSGVDSVKGKGKGRGRGKIGTTNGAAKATNVKRGRGRPSAATLGSEDTLSADPSRPVSYAALRSQSLLAEEDLSVLGMVDTATELCPSDPQQALTQILGIPCATPEVRQAQISRCRSTLKHLGETKARVGGAMELLAGFLDGIEGGDDEMGG